MTAQQPRDPIACAQCGTPFVRRLGAKYCSGKCREDFGAEKVKKARRLGKAPLMSKDAMASLISKIMQ